MSVSAVYLLAVTQDSPVFLMSTCVSQAQLSRKYNLILCRRLHKLVQHGLIAAAR